MTNKKLELKHLAPYLPYGLKTYLKYDGIPLYGELHAVNIMSFVYGDTNKKIVLRPLSDLTKEIEHSEKRFVPSNELRLFLQCDIDWWSDYNNIKYSQYDMVNKLIQWHFDVFGLIESGLAVNMNEI